MEIWPGEPYPLGATYDGYGTNFAIHSQVASAVELCLFDDAGQETRVPLQESTAFTWHGYTTEVAPGQRYGFRVYGPFEPEQGHLCNPNKLLLDPYAKAVDGEVTWHESLFDFDARRDCEVQRPEDTGPYVPKSVVVDPYFDWREERSPRIPWHETIIYELHVKGFSKLNANIPRDLRGTYAGLAHPGSIEYLTRLGVTAVELLPTQHFLTEPMLAAKGLTNYWGYNTIGYFAPHTQFSSRTQPGAQVREFKYMVRELHAAGIEVLLDVVYNHTAEGGRGGPTLCLRGLDNANYYRLSPADRRHYVDYTGCGNTLNMRDPYVLQLLMDSLRYWVTEMRVDGFRFDLASALARELHAVDRLSAFFDLIQQDPVLQNIKLIAEPWDLGEGGYQVGNFPAKWSEWNGRYRDSVRDFWRGQDQALGEFAFRLTGSSDLYERTGRRPHASINFITAHDGFTLRDLNSYNEKHNAANLEANRDGESHNRSWNCGVEGATNDPKVQQLRERQERNFLFTLLLSQGVPMLVAGDEFGRTQGGNNNAYCQDNEVSWLHWGNMDRRLYAFARETIKVRQTHPIFRRSQFFQGESIRGSNLTDIGWFRPDGNEMVDDDWRMHFARAVSVFLNGQGIRTPNARGERIIDDSFLVFFNAHSNYVEFRLPHVLDDHVWRDELNTAWPELNRRKESFHAGEVVRVEAHSIRMLKRRRRLPPRQSMPGHAIPSEPQPSSEPPSLPLVMGTPSMTPAPERSAAAQDILLDSEVTLPKLESQRGIEATPTSAPSTTTEAAAKEALTTETSKSHEPPPREAATPKSVKPQLIETSRAPKVGLVPKAATPTPPRAAPQDTLATSESDAPSEPRPAVVTREPAKTVPAVPTPPSETPPDASSTERDEPEPDPKKPKKST